MPSVKENAYIQISNPQEVEPLLNDIQQRLEAKGITSAISLGSPLEGLLVPKLSRVGEMIQGSRIAREFVLALLDDSSWRRTRQNAEGVPAIMASSSNPTSDGWELDKESMRYTAEVNKRFRKGEIEGHVVMKPWEKHPLPDHPSPQT